MIGVIGALVAFAVVLAIVVVLAVRPPVRRVARAAGLWRGDLAVRVARLAALRRDRPAPAPVSTAPVLTPLVPAQVAPPGAAVWPSSIGGRGRHRRVDGAP